MDDGTVISSMEMRGSDKIVRFLVPCSFPFAGWVAGAY